MNRFYSYWPSFSPFASSSEDTAEEILAQIGSGKFITKGGNWDLVSDAAKVLIFSFLVNYNTHKMVLFNKLISCMYMFNRKL